MTALLYRPVIVSIADRVGDWLFIHEWQQCSLGVDMCHKMLVHVSAFMYVMHCLLGCIQ
jgi:hypothetical protein